MKDHTLPPYNPFFARFEPNRTGHTIANGDLTGKQGDTKAFLRALIVDD
jgi:hypothetical protein